MTMTGVIQKSIDYIETNLHSDIGVADVANAVCYSQFYFSRQFSLGTHISVYDYILKRRLSEAYKTLFADAPRILDLALRYGFQSHEVFTRAFRKMFGENPSEAAIYKPLLVYERIDSAYLSFLADLKIEIMGSDYPNCFFEVEAEAKHEDNTLMILSDNLLSCQTLLTGRLKTQAERNLCFRLNSLKGALRIHHTDIRSSIRYFIDNFYDIDRMASNFILLKKVKDHIDFIIPGK